MTTPTTRLPHVGLCGAATCGKNTAADALTRRGWQPVAFADPLRAMAIAVDPYVEIPGLEGVSFLRLSYVVDNLGWDHAKAYPDVRRFLQRLGTDGVRNHLGTELWVQAAMARADAPSVFTDVRFPNEAQAIRDAGGIVIRLYRPDADPVIGHVSEDAMNDWPVDVTIANDATIGELHVRVQAAVDGFVRARS